MNYVLEKPVIVFYKERTETPKLEHSPRRDISFTQAKKANTPTTLIVKLNTQN